MVDTKNNESDIAMIMSHRYDHGYDYWTTPDKRLIKGAPFTTLGCILYLLELDVSPTEPILKESSTLVFSSWQEDGRFRLYPTGAIYPCQSALGMQALCHLGYVDDARIQKTMQYFLDMQSADGGWRCEKYYFGRGPETQYSNPHPTLIVLDAFRFSRYLNQEKALDQAVEFLLAHWESRKPLGPCHYGIGKLFMQIEYPFRNYNLFQYVYILSFYNYAKKDKRFLEALAMLESKMVDGQIIVERVVPKLATLNFCKKGKPSFLATKRYHKILDNLTQKDE